MGKHSYLCTRCSHIDDEHASCVAAEQHKESNMHYPCSHEGCDCPDFEFYPLVGFTGW